MIAFILGLIAMGCGTVGIFFYQFWRETHDRLFALFSIAFFVLALERLYPIASPFPTELGVFQYIARLIAYIIILFAIVDKNLKEERWED